MKTTQRRHEDLFTILSELPQYKDRVSLVKEERNTDLADIDSNDVRVAANIFTDCLNITSGSNGNFQLYRLLEGYLTIPKVREKINNIIDDAFIEKK